MRPDGGFDSMGIEARMGPDGGSLSGATGGLLAGATLAMLGETTGVALIRSAGGAVMRSPTLAMLPERVRAGASEIALETRGCDGGGGGGPADGVEAIAAPLGVAGSAHFAMIRK
jgi:hypothetical protein